MEKTLTAKVRDSEDGVVEVEEEEEDLWDNPLFTSIRSRIEDFEENACKLGWVVLVPSSERLEGQTDFSKSFLSRHVLFTSPYLKNELVTLNGDRVRVDEGALEVLSNDGAVAGKLEILGEEPMYTTRGSYKVLRVDRAMKPDRVNRAPITELLEDKKVVFDDERKVKDWMTMLNKDANNGVALRYLEDFAENMKRSYVLVANQVGISDFLRKMGTGIEKALSLLLEKNPQRFGAAYKNKSYQLILKRALEAYGFMGVHHMVFQSLTKFYMDQEKLFRAQAALRREGVSSSVLERTSREFFLDLNKQDGPMAKLQFLQEYLSATSRDKEVALSADHILNTLVERIIHIPATDDVHVIANMQYVRNFSVYPKANDLNYLACQFHIAVCFVSDTKFEDITAMDTEHKPQIIAHPNTPRRFRSSFSANLLRPGSASSSGSSSFSASLSPRSQSSDVALASRLGAIGFGSTQYTNVVDTKRNVEADAVSDEESEDESEEEGFTSESSVDDSTQENSLGGFLQALQSTTADVVSSRAKPKNSLSYS